MNPFINPKKRSISLPSGCKDLADVLRSAAPEADKSKRSDPYEKHIQSLIHALLLQSRERGATELAIGPLPDPDADRTDCTVTERIDGTWHHVRTIPFKIRCDIVAELVRTAAFTEARFPGVGLICLQLKQKRLMWRIDMESPGSQCVLTPLRE